MPPKPKRQPKLRTLKYRLLPSDVAEMQLLECSIESHIYRVNDEMYSLERCLKAMERIRRRFEGK